MTSQIVLFNGHGVAIASDSAQTTGESVVDTAEKIIPSPDPHQIAVIISDQTFFHAYPVYALVREWFSSLGSKRLSTARAYSDSFVGFLDSSGLFSEDRQIAHLNIAFLAMLEKVQTAFNQRSEDDVQDTVTAIRAVTGTFTLGLLTGVDEKMLSVLGESLQFGERIEALCRAYWPDYWTTNGVPAEPEDEEIEAMKELMAIYVTRSLWGISQTSIAFVGYGEHELMPSFHHRDIRAHLAGRTLGRLQGEQKFEDDGINLYVGIKPLGQVDAINQFIRGYRFDLYSEADGAITTSLDTALSRLETGTNDYASEVRKQSSEALLRVFQENDRSEPFTTTVSVLPMASLVSVAESLIQVQALSVLLQRDLRTVGGPIDSAIITRADGFTWIRHKSIDAH